MTRLIDSATFRVVRLELRAIIRNRAVRWYILVGPLLGVGATILVLNLPDEMPSMAGLIYLASIFGSANYALLAFSWNASHAAGLFFLPLGAQSHLAGRMITAALLAVGPVILLSVYLALTRPAWAGLPAASGLFGVSVLALPTLLAAMRMPKVYDANEPPLSNLRRWGLKHYLPVIPMVVPELLIRPFVSTHQFIGILLVLSFIGLATLYTFRARLIQLMRAGLPLMSDRARTIK